MFGDKKTDRYSHIDRRIIVVRLYGNRDETAGR